MSLSTRPKPVSRLSTQRLPPPSLFQGPPSRNESVSSLQTGLMPTSQGHASSQRPDIQRTRSRMSEISPSVNRGLSPSLIQPKSRRDTDSAEILWQEMQNTLGEVEISAFKGEHVFGEEHSKALDELRLKQLKLAQAWSRNEADDVDDDAKKDAAPLNHSDFATHKPRNSSSSHDNGRAPSTTEGAATYKALEAETEKDLQQARKRRLANDEYFDRVNNSVLDVVASLEEVAQAMRAVRKESEDIWNDTSSDSFDTTAGSTTG